MRVLVTRPQPDAEDTARQLSARGHEPMLAPLLEIVPEPGLEIDLASVQAILATSANGARAVAAATDRRDLPVFAVGAATAAAAKGAGFARVESADGDVESLVSLVCAELDPNNGRLLHAAGSVSAGDLSGRLQDAGFGVDREILYRAEFTPKMPGIASESVQNGLIDAVLLYSPRTAARFAELVVASGLENACKSLSAVCLSPSVADRLGDLVFRSVHIADSPDQEHLFAALEGIST